MEYPRTVILEDKKLRTLLEEKDELVITGREASIEIEEKEQEMKSVEDEIKKAEDTADMTDLIENAKVITEEFNAVVQKMEIAKQAMFDRARSAVPPELYTKYEDIKKLKEDLETERNKIGLKIQQKKDKIIPLVQKLMKPYLENEFEDYDGIRIEDGQMIGTIFNHLHDFTNRFKTRNKN